MFDKAKRFVIQNGAFIENLYVKKVDRRSLPTHTTRSNDVHQEESQLISNCRQLPMGDIHVLDGRVQVDSVSNDVVVEVSGETKRRAARIYRGPHGQAQLKKELEILSKLCPHPRIRQVFGIFKCNDTTGVVFHDDGTHRRFGEYVLSLPPFQRAPFVIKYTRDYLDTCLYLRPYTADLFKLVYSIDLRFGIVVDKMNLYSPMGKISGGSRTGDIDFYISSAGRINTVLSMYNRDIPQCDEMSIISLHVEVSDKGNLSQNDFELIDRYLNHDSINSLPHVTMIQLISACHSICLTVGRTAHMSNSRHKFECLLGNPVWFWTSSSLRCSDRIHYLSGNFKIAVQQQFEWSSVPLALFQREPLRVRQFTCFKLITNPILSRNEDYQNVSFRGCCRLSDETYRNWLYQAPQILKRHTYIHDATYNLGIVSHVGITIHITIYSSYLIHHMEKNKDTEIYLFISDPGIDAVDGRVSEPHIYWSLDKSGAERITEFSAALKGLFIREIQLCPEIIAFWDKFYYEALHELHKMCRLSTSDISLCHGLQQREQKRKTPPYMEDIYMDCLKTQHEIEKDQEFWHNGQLERTSAIIEHYQVISSRNERYSPWIKSQCVSSLDWIGITSLEDGLGLLGTVYQTRDHCNKLEKVYGNFQAKFSSIANGEDWENISYLEADVMVLDADLFEEV